MDDSQQKSTHLVVRIDIETKDAFMQKAKAEGRNASALVMNFIESYLKGDFFPESHTEDLVAEIEKLKKDVAEIRGEIAGKLAA